MTSCTTAYHDTIKADPQAWAALARLPLWVLEDDGYRCVMDSRNCSHCGSTLVDVVEEVIDGVASGRASGR